MDSFREQVLLLLDAGQAFTYANFAEHGDTQPAFHDGFEYAPARTWPKAVTPDFESWLARCGSVIRRCYGEDHHAYATFVEKRKVPLVGYDDDHFLDVRNGLLGLLRGLIDDLDGGLVTDPLAPPPCASGLPELRLVCDRFHRVVVQLRRRREDRPTLDVDDEYDVQDLLHALLKLYFDDVRPEEWTPSYAGSSARMDFLLKDAGIVVEVKRTRRGLADREIGKQLIEDAAHYAQHSDCAHLVCFIYDPEERLANPTGLKSDVEKQSREGFAVEVIIGT